MSVENLHHEPSSTGVSPNRSRENSISLQPDNDEDIIDHDTDNDNEQTNMDTSAAKIDSNPVLVPESSATLSPPSQVQTAKLETKTKKTTATGTTKLKRKASPSNNSSNKKKVLSATLNEPEDVITAAARASGIDIKGMHENNKQNKENNNNNLASPTSYYSSASNINNINNQKTSSYGGGGAVTGNLPGYNARNNRKPTVGGRLAQSRISAGINQHEVASKCNVPVNKIFQIEKGQDEEGLERYAQVLAHLAIALGVPFVEIFGDYLAVTTNPHVVGSSSNSTIGSASSPAGSTGTLPPPPSGAGSGENFPSATSIVSSSGSGSGSGSSPSPGGGRRNIHTHHQIPPWKLTVGGRVKHFREAAKISLDHLAGAMEDIFISIYGERFWSLAAGRVNSSSFSLLPGAAVVDGGTSSSSNALLGANSNKNNKLGGASSGNLLASTSQSMTAGGRATSAKNLKRATATKPGQQQQQQARPLSPSFNTSASIDESLSQKSGTTSPMSSAIQRPSSPPALASNHSNNIRAAIKNELEDLEMCDTQAEDVIPILLYVLYRTGTPLASVVL